MKRSGAVRLIYGLETGSPRLQKYVGKNIDIERFSSTLRIADELGIWNGVEVICGLPHEDDRDVDDTISFLRNHRPWINELYINAFRLVPNSLFVEHPDKFRLTNIRTIGLRGASRSILDVPLRKRLLKYSFDEVGGYGWEEKQKQTSRSYKRIVTAERKQHIPNFENIPYLFYFYDCLHDKDRVKRVYRRYSTVLTRKALFRLPRYVVNELLKVRSFTYAARMVSFFLGRWGNA